MAQECWIDVDRSSSTIRLMVGNESVGYWWAAMGFDDSDNGFYATAIVSYDVYEKNAASHLDLWGEGLHRVLGRVPPGLVQRLPFLDDGLKNGNVIEGGDGATGGCVAIDSGLAAAL